MKPKGSKKLSEDDLRAIDLLCRQSLKKYLQGFSPEKLRELFVSSKCTEEEPLPKHLRLEYLVAKRYQEQQAEDFLAIDLLCRKSLKQFLQGLPPERLRELFISSKCTEEEPLPKHLRLENLVANQYQEQRLNSDSTRNRNLKAAAPTSVAHRRGKSVASKNMPEKVGRKADLLKEPTRSPLKLAVVPGGKMDLVKKTVRHSKGRNTTRQLTVVSGDLPSAKAIADYCCEWPGCKTRRASLANVRAHMNVHLETFKCTVCKKCFESAGHLRAHYVCHENFRPFACSFCGRAFKLETILNRHLKRLHSSEEKPFKCPDCTASAWTYQNISKHRVAIHHWNWRNEDAN